MSKRERWRLTWMRRQRRRDQYRRYKRHLRRERWRRRRLRIEHRYQSWLKKVGLWKPQSRGPKDLPGAGGDED